jgi:hypothetical protein
MPRRDTCVQALFRRRVEQRALAQAGCGPATDHGFSTLGQAALVDLHRQGRDIGVVDRVGYGIDQRRIGDHGQRRVDQVEDGAQVDRKGLLALADEQLGRHRAARNADVVDVLGGIARIVGNRLGADVVDRLVEGGTAADCVGDGGTLAGAAVAADDVDRVLLIDIQRCRVRGSDLAGLDQGDGHTLATHRQRERLEVVLEAELERQVFLGVAIVVDVDLVQRVRVHLEVVRAAVGSLQRLVVGDHGNVLGTARFVAAEHVEVSAIDLGLGGDEGRLAVARSLYGLQRQGGERRGGGGGQWQQPQGAGEGFHGVCPLGDGGGWGEGEGFRPV